ncbi:MAG: PBP1A family penicillin-binding protein [Smithella sp.]
MIRRSLCFFFLFLILIVLVHIGYVYFKVDKGIAEISNESPSIFYGRPTKIKTGDHLGTIHFTERLQRLYYKKVSGKPSKAGTFSENGNHIFIYLGNKGIEKSRYENGPVNITIRDGLIVSILSATGQQLDSIYLESEEIGRITGPKMGFRHPVTLQEISPYLQKAVVASEDAHFYSHSGIDFSAIIRASLTNVKEKRFAEGGSTITQQLAKNFFLSPQKTLGRKLHEAELALVLELHYSKKQILEMYLNKIYLGQADSQGIFGAEEASNIYFSKHAKDLSLEEAALLAGIIHSPNRYFLFQKPESAKERRDRVLARMQKLSMIGEDEFRKASASPVRLRPSDFPARLSSSYFVDYIQRITRDELGSDKLYHTGYHYYTTLDPVHQAAAEDAVSRGIKEIERKASSTGEPLQAALVAVDPKTGAMTAMVGGRNYGQSRFNRAIDARRQPGSAFKPFVLLAALSQPAQDKTARALSTAVSGEPISVSTPEGMWTPVNFEGKKYEKITIRKMIEDSVNTATVRLANDVGLEEVLKTARAAGITSPLLPVPSMALGSFEVTPVELAYAYATIASGGIRYEPFPLSSVVMPDGNVVISRINHPKQVFNQQISYLASYAMEGVLTRGTAKAVRKLGINFPASGKTGTTNDNRDSWFVGYTPDIVCAVWVGYDSGSNTRLTGAKGALHIWARFLKTLYRNSAPSTTIPPKGIEFAQIDPESGYLATTACPEKIQEAYIEGTIPKETCPLHPVNPVMDNLRKGVRGVGKFFRNLFK